MKTVWLHFPYSMFYLIGFTLALRVAIKLIGFLVQVRTLRGYASCGIELEEESYINKVSELAKRFKIEKPIKLRLAPNAIQQNVIVSETDTYINIFFLRNLCKDGLTGTLAHELSHVALGHTRQTKPFTYRRVLFLFSLTLVLGLVMLHDNMLYQTFKPTIRLILLALLLSFGIIDLPKSRERELQADRLAAQTVGKSEVIKFLNGYKKTNPVDNFWGQFPFGTHPPLNKRIKAVDGLEINNPERED